MAIDKTPVQVLEGQLFKGMKMFRKIKDCKLSIDDDYIYVTYDEWLESPSGDKVDLKQVKGYKVVDEKEVSFKTKNENDEEVINVISEAKFMYQKWVDFTIVPEMVGAKLGNDIIIKTIKDTLKVLPFDVADGYITQP